MEIITMRLLEGTLRKGKLTVTPPQRIQRKKGKVKVQQQLGRKGTTRIVWRPSREESVEKTSV